MPEWPLLRALRGGHATRSLSLTGRRLCRLPWGLAKMRALECLDLRNNRLCRLPPDMEALGRLKVLNLGNNIFEEIPEQLMCLKSLQKLHLFGNKITRMSPLICGGLQNLVLLNLNNNLLSHLPPEIHRLENLECLSLNNNQLRSIPRELCSLQKLCELHLSHNSLTALPEEIGHLTELKILSLSRNQIEELPEGICKMVSLRVLDLAGNNIQIFPIAMQDLELVELYCEGNPLLQRHPVSAIQEEEVLTLKEITARFILAQLKSDNLSLHRAIKQNAEAQNILSQQRECAQCGCSFLNIWLECVQFVDVKQRMKTSRNLHLLPVRILLCSYQCFNRHDDGLFGIAVP
ncbi:leucine-rich repeat-containing protein 69 isoform X2 [Sphaerodactylus townsendi]|uniref:leucine-rich repeat-containing protein 69 isoform X2 n=1 Tax=Sphaerodactylus townsendi TaxID=933632 RepID=UPI00202666E2|nr:leucine-rich repeat-containing protein 69 isoform X2 [Sphaerodactylus townsendi]